MSKSIMQTKKECFICGDIRQGLQRHHCLHGAYRQKAEEWGCWVWLCWKHHTGSPMSVHHNSDMDRNLQREAQRRFEALYGHEKFMEKFGRSWL